MVSLKKIANMDNEKINLKLKKSMSLINHYPR